VIFPPGLYRRIFKGTRGSFGGRSGKTSTITQIQLPDGDLIWVRVADRSADQGAAGPRDVRLGGKTSEPGEGARLLGFGETVRGVVASVKRALADYQPDSFEVEFGIEIDVRSGKALSVLAEAGGRAHLRVTASWRGRDPDPPLGP
jgi:Trypsin-co-occurring domain 1